MGDATRLGGGGRGGCNGILHTEAGMVRGVVWRGRVLRKTLRLRNVDM